MTITKIKSSDIEHNELSGLEQLTAIRSIEDVWAYVEGNTLEQLKINLVNYQRKRNSFPEISTIISNEQLEKAFDEISLFFRGGLPQNHWYEYINDAKENIEEYKWLFNTLLKEHRSKDIFFNLFYSRLTLSKEHSRAAFCSETQYFDDRIVTFLNGEVLVDCGAYTGDSVIDYILKNPFYARIYTYEAFPECLEKCKINLSQVMDDGRIIIREVAVTNKKGLLNFRDNPFPASNAIDDSGKIKIQGVSLDDDIPERVTFIKMDIEGAELLALEGARRHIVEEKPTLAICVYHYPDHLWKVAKLIYSINPGYTFVLRQHSICSCVETVLYAISPDREPYIIEDPIMKSVLAHNSFAVRFRDTEMHTMLQIRDTYIDQLEDAKLWFLQQLDNYQKALKNLDVWSQGEMSRYKAEIEILQKELIKQNAINVNRQFLRRALSWIKKGLNKLGF